MSSNHFYLNRTLCDVFDEMRKANEVRNYSYMLGLIEEAQSMANRMEAALSNSKDIVQLTDLRTKLKAEVKQLEEQVKGKKAALGIAEPKEDL